MINVHSVTKPNAQCENILAAVYSAYCTNLWHQRVSNIRVILILFPLYLFCYPHLPVYELWRVGKQCKLPRPDAGGVESSFC